LRDVFELLLSEFYKRKVDRQHFAHTLYGAHELIA